MYYFYEVYRMHENIIAFILGIVEGLTEFIPVSSTGHMVIVGDMLQFTGEKASVFEVFIQLGAILAVTIVYRTRIGNMLQRKNWFRKDGLSLVHIAIGMFPAMAVGFLAHSFIKTHLFSHQTVIIGLIVGALFMIYAEKRRPKYISQTVDDISYGQALKIGLFQVLALWPGFSRSGSTIAGGLLVGVNRKAGADFTFLMAVPIMLIACLYDFLKVFHDLERSDLVVFAIGFVTAFVVAYLSIIWFLRFLNRSTLVGFAVYRFFFALFATAYFYLIL